MKKLELLEIIKDLNFKVENRGRLEQDRLHELHDSVGIDLELFIKSLNGMSPSAKNDSVKNLFKLLDAYQLNLKFFVRVNYKLEDFMRNLSDSDLYKVFFYQVKTTRNLKYYYKMHLNFLDPKLSKRLKETYIYLDKPTCKYFIADYIYEYRKGESLGKVMGKLISIIRRPKAKPLDKITLGLDFDGVIHNHNKPYDNDNPYDMSFTPNKEIISAIQEMKKLFENSMEIHIVTLRAQDDNSIPLVEKYLSKYKVPYDVITTKISPEIDLLIDDRALYCYDTFPALFAAITQVPHRVPWYQDLKGDPNNIFLGGAKFGFRIEHCATGLKKENRQSEEGVFNPQAQGLRKPDRKPMIKATVNSKKK